MAEMDVYSGPAIEESVSAVTLSPSVDLGQERVHKGDRYKYCYNAGGSSVNVGYGVALVTAASGYSVAGTGVTDVPLPMVGAIKHATMITASYGWVLTKGFLNLHTANSILAGGHVAIGGQAGIADEGIGFGLASGPATVNACGFKMGAAATASVGTFYGFLNCDV